MTIMMTMMIFVVVIAAILFIYLHISTTNNVRRILRTLRYATVLFLCYRTSSKTTTIHKHFAACISLSQIVFMFGIDRLEHQVWVFYRS